MLISLPAPPSNDRAYSLRPLDFLLALLADLRHHVQTLLATLPLAVITAKPTSARACATMPRSKKSATITRLRSGRSGSSATSARGGSRSGPTRRCVRTASISISEDRRCDLLTHLLVLQNTAYVVTEGARQKNEQWDPAENGQMVIGESARSAMNHAGCDRLRPGRKLRMSVYASHDS